MNGRMILAAGTFCALFSSLAFAENGITTTDAARIRVQAQIELLPLGSTTDRQGTTVLTTDSAVAYGASGMFDYALTPYLSVGVAPRLIFNVTPANAPPQASADKELDLRARISGHYAAVSGLEVYAAVAPGYTFILSSDNDTTAYKGFALGGAVGVTYELSPRMFIGGEVGYQRAFTRSTSQRAVRHSRSISTFPTCTLALAQARASRRAPRASPRGAGGLWSLRCSCQGAPGSRDAPGGSRGP